MKTYRSPVYPALAVRVGDHNVKASGGYFTIEDEDVEAFEAFIANRPLYRIEEAAGRDRSEDTRVAGVTGTLTTTSGKATTAAGDPHGAVNHPEPMSDSERHPETVKIESFEAMNVPTLRARLEEIGEDSRGNKPQLIERLVAATNTPDGESDADSKVPGAAVADPDEDGA